MIEKKLITYSPIPNHARIKLYWKLYDLRASSVVYTFMANVHSTAEKKRKNQRLSPYKPYKPKLHIKTIQMICTANQLTRFYMSVTLLWYWFRISLVNMMKLASNCGYVLIELVTHCKQNRKRHCNQ